MDCSPLLSALLPFILTWNSPRWTSRAPSMSHMSCKAPHRVAQHPPPGRAEGDTQRPCHTEACGWRGASSGPGEPPTKLGLAPTTFLRPRCPPRCTPAGCGPAPAGSLGRRGWAGTWRRPAACWRRRHAGGTGYSSPRKVHPPAGAQEGGRCPREEQVPRPAYRSHPLGEAAPALPSPPQTLTAVTPCAGSPAPPGM